MLKRSNFKFDLSEVKEFKFWPPRGQNGKSMPFLKSLTPKTKPLDIHDAKKVEFQI